MYRVSRLAVRRSLLILFLVLALLGLPVPAGAGQTFTVTTTATTGDGICDATCTWGEAVSAAEANSTLDTIAFSIAGAGPHTITSGAYFYHPVIIDGYTQSGASPATATAAAVLKIEFDGSGGSKFSPFITLAGGSSMVRGIVVNGVPHWAVSVTGPGGTTVAGNHLGTNPAGTAADANNGGVKIEGSPNNTIGGTSPADRNVISGNNGGVQIYGSGATGNKILGNYVGIDATGTAALGNKTLGIDVAGVSGTVVGGSAPGAGNVVSANNVGVDLRLGATNTKVDGNRIGVDATGTTDLGNNWAGVFIDDGSNNTIGALAPNIIAHNRPGIEVWRGSGNTIAANILFENTGLGIDLQPIGVTPNDALDVDTGPNGLQNYPVITAITSGAGGTNIAGTLDAAASTTHTLRFFHASVCDGSGYGEGDSLIGSTTVTTDSSGHGTFNPTYIPTLTTGDFVTATGTSPTDGTSEFSRCMIVNQATATADLAVSLSDFLDPIMAGGVQTYTVKVNNLGPYNAGGVLVTTNLPASTIYQSADPTQGSCTEASGTVTCDLLDILNGGNATITIKVIPKTVANISASAAVSSGNPDPAPANNSATQSTTVITAAPLTLAVNSTSDVVDNRPGDQTCDTGNTTSSGAAECTLRAAIQEANALPLADTVTLPTGTYTLTRAGDKEDLAVTGDLDVLDDLTLSGAGAATVVVDGGSLDRVFEFHTDTTATVDGVTIRNGTSTTGAGILSVGDLTVTSSKVTDNTGPGVRSSGALDLDGVEVARNTDAGVSNLGTATISNADIHHNTVSWCGGGVFNSTFGSLQLEDSSIHDNTSSDKGGGICNSGSVWLTDTKVADNSATEGGGIYSAGHQFTQNSATVSLTRVVVSGNTSEGIHSRENSFVGLTDTTIENNTGPGLRNEYVFVPTYDPIDHFNSTVYGVGVTISGNGTGIKNSGEVDLLWSTVSGNTLGVDNSGLIYLRQSSMFGVVEEYRLATVDFQSSTITANTKGIDSATDIYLENTIIDGNGTDCINRSWWPSVVTKQGFVSEGYNFGDETTCNLTHLTDLPPVGPTGLVGPLADNGGHTKTHALLSGSAAIDAGTTDPLKCGWTDQRDVARPADGDGNGTAACDIGAYEAAYPDADGDGITDAIDGRLVSGLFTSDAAVSSDDFTDQHLGGSTHGQRVGGGPALTIADPTAPTGVKIMAGTGSGASVVKVCDYTTKLTDGDSATFTCSSLSATVEQGPVELLLDTGIVAELATGTTATVTVQSDGSHLITVTAGAVTIFHDGTAAQTITPGSSGSSNRPPTADPNGPYTVAEGGTVGLDGAGSTDPDGDPLEALWDLDDDGVFETAGVGYEFSAAGRDDGTQTVGLRVSDPYGSVATAGTVVHILNAAPQAGSITGPSQPVAIGDTIGATLAFTDAGVLDTHTVTFDWGDGTQTPGTVVQGAGFGSASAVHAYSLPGVYRIAAEVTDDDGGMATAVFEFAVVFDPDGGFVTGAGWMESPEGAYKPDLDLAGKATFGFVSKYTKGADEPTGSTEFQFHAGDLDFHSTQYNWLLVTGSDDARFKGVGTINEDGSYLFMIWAADGNPDRLRIKIWQEDEFGTETVVYDNGFDQALAGGSIVIHTKK